MRMSSLYLFDPTATDEQSKVRGIGRYVQLLKASLKNIEIVNDPAQISKATVLINPFFDPIKPQVITGKLADRQVAVIHDLIPLKYSRHFPIGLRGSLNVFLSKKQLQNYDMIVTDSEVSKKDIMRFLKVEDHKITVIYPTVGHSFMKEATNSKPTTTNYCIYVGDATWNKNIVNIAKAVQIENTTCYFVGKVFSTQPTTHAWHREFQEFVNITKDDKRFIFPGFVSDEELRSLYKNATANLLVSRDEGFGFSYFEAASQRTPSVLADRPIFHEMAQDTAIFVDPDDPMSIAQGISRLYSDAALRKKLATDAYSRLKQFSSEQFTSQWTKVVTQ
jgi:glycosyltransferase involved in cell wall biosynthesis